MDSPALQSRVSRRALIAGGLALGLTPMLPRITGTASADFGFAPPDTTSQVVRPMVFPVDGTVFWVDTFGACRDGCTRHHEGQDLMGTKLQKLIACVTGTVVGFKYDTTGNFLYIQDADGWYYGYLHVNNDTPGTDDGANPANWAFAPGIALGSKVTQGQLLGYLGDSGTAETTAPHLHYEIRKPSDAWYHASAVNPKYSLNAATHVTPGSTVDPGTFAPWTTAGAFVTQQYLDFLARPVSTSELTGWTSRLDTAQATPVDVIEALMADPASDQVTAALIRLYYACFDRPPDTSGLVHWLGLARAGTSLDAVANSFSKTTEFRRRYGAVTSGEFVDQVYLRLQGRMPDPAGKLYWVGQLNSGMTRGQLIHIFAELPYYRNVTTARVRLCVVYAGMLGRAPDLAAYLYWLDETVNNGRPLAALIVMIQMSPEYANRFPAATRSRETVTQPQASPSAPTPNAPTTTAPPATTAPAPTAAPATSPPATAPPSTMPPHAVPPTTTTTTRPPSTVPRTTTTVPRPTTTVPRTTTTVPRTTTTVPRTTTTVPRTTTSTTATSVPGTTTTAPRTVTTVLKRILAPTTAP